MDRRKQIIKIKKLLLDAETTEQSIADRLGIHISYISQIIRFYRTRGQRVQSIRKYILKAINKKLGTEITFKELWGQEKNEN
jgi:hypothetical protein